MSEPLKTLLIDLYPRDALRIIGAEHDLPYGFVARGTPDQFNVLLLDHYIDDSDTTLQIRLKPDGTWSATKHIEV